MFKETFEPMCFVNIRTYRDRVRRSMSCFLFSAWCIGFPIKGAQSYSCLSSDLWQCFIIFLFFLTRLAVVKEKKLNYISFNLHVNLILLQVLLKSHSNFVNILISAKCHG